MLAGPLRFQHIVLFALALLFLPLALFAFWLRSSVVSVYVSTHTRSMEHR